MFIENIGDNMPSPKTVLYLPLALILVFSVPVYGDTDSEKTVNYNRGNLRYIKFGGFVEDVVPHGELVEAIGTPLKTPSSKWRRSEMERWQTAIKEAVSLLPTAFLKELGVGLEKTIEWYESR